MDSGTGVEVLVTARVSEGLTVLVEEGRGVTECVGSGDSVGATGTAEAIPCSTALWQLDKKMMGITRIAARKIRLGFLISSHYGLKVKSV